MLLSAPKPQHLHEIFQTCFIDLLTVHENGQGDVFGDREDGDEVVELIDQSDLPAAEDGKLFFILRIHIAAVHPDLAGGGSVHAAQNVQQSGFSRTGRSDDGDKLALVDGKGDVIECMDDIFSLAIGLAEMFDSQYFHRSCLLMYLYPRTRRISG